MNFLYRSSFIFFLTEEKKRRDKQKIQLKRTNSLHILYIILVIYIFSMYVFLRILLYLYYYLDNGSFLRAD